jgi:imidazolonepropionase-like amidohydrolase
VPAGYLGLSQKMGALQPGMYANFFITNGNVFDEATLLLENWTAGERYTLVDAEMPDIRGNWKLDIAGKVYALQIAGDYYKPKATVKIDTVKKAINLQVHAKQISFSFSPDTLTIYRGSGSYSPAANTIEGRAQLQNGNWTDFTIQFQSKLDTTKKNKPIAAAVQVTSLVPYPFSAYGSTLAAGPANFRDRFVAEKKPYSALLIKNVTVWTNTADSILNNVDVLIVDNRISKIGKSLTAPASAKIIDGTGRHLSAGIIDEHSHIALTHGVNEGTQASSAEVRMGDVINPEDINIYRQLSGGVVAAQLLHGSANPIGGQSAIIKLRWGMGAEDLKITGARPFIKFALGENVKQSNWGDHNVVRFPQSRMGVEQVFFDFFTRAKAYEMQKQAALKSGAKGKLVQPRKDLELEALSEIILSKRFITCHSYVQSEINMLMHVADSFGFKVNTFTHILEGYKVADKMKAHGVAASTFSDWWAYKNEVLEAIPYNAAILNKMGIVTAINSDDAEMARRLNQEAAKCVKYGGLSEVAALKLVTLNPAIMLRLDADMGSIAEGKSADVVLWSDNPLSVYAKADYTIIDGVIYFDRQEDAKKRKEIQAERARLVNLMLAEKQKGMPVVKPLQKKEHFYHCNTIEGVSETQTGQR